MTPQYATILRYTRRHKDGTSTPGIIVRNANNRIFIDKDQLATFANYAIDTLEHYEQDN